MLEAPTKRSATARLDNRMFESLCNSFFCFTAMITNLFKTIIAGEATDAKATKILGVTVSVKSHKKFGASGQKNTDLTASVDELAPAVSALLKFMAEFRITGRRLLVTAERTFCLVGLLVLTKTYN